MKPQTSVPQPQSGFTLVEMMVALAIFAILASAGVGMLRASVDTQAAVDQRLAEVGSLGRLEAVLTSDLAQALDRPSRGPSGERPAFEGDPTGLRMVRTGHANLDEAARSELQRVEWRSAAQAITRSGYTNVDGGDDTPAIARLAKDVRRAAFRYRLADGSWTASFRSSPRQALPSAVELSLERLGAPAIVMVFALPQAGAAA